MELQEQYDKIYRYCYFKLRDSSLAEDITQETFLRFLNQNSYRDIGKETAYLYTIAKNLCMNEYQKRKTVISSSEELEEISSGQEDIETRIAVKEAVHTLPADLQELLMLRFSNELSLQEITRITGISRFAVYRKINLAMKQLKQSLRKEDFYE